MTKVYVVSAYWSDDEWQREDLVGVYSSEELALAAQKVYEEDIQRIRDLESPLTEEEKEMDIKELPDDRWDIWYDWNYLVNSMCHFSNIKIQEIVID